MQSAGKLIYGEQRENKGTTWRTRFGQGNGPHSGLSVLCPRPTAALELPSSAHSQPKAALGPIVLYFRCSVA